MSTLYRPGKYQRQPEDFYPTPNSVTECLLATIPLRGFIWEPCAGDGSMAKVLADAGHTVVATDLVRREPAVYPVFTGIDALTAPLPAGVETILRIPLTALCSTTSCRAGWICCSLSTECWRCSSARAGVNRRRARSRRAGIRPSRRASSSPILASSGSLAAAAAGRSITAGTSGTGADPAKAPLELATGDSGCSVRVPSAGSRSAPGRPGEDLFGQCRVTLSPEAGARVDGPRRPWGGSWCASPLGGSNGAICSTWARSRCGGRWRASAVVRAFGPAGTRPRGRRAPGGRRGFDPALRGHRPSGRRQTLHPICDISELRLLCMQSAENRQGCVLRNLPMPLPPLDLLTNHLR